MTATSPSPDERRPYERNELKCLKKDQLADLVLAEFERWPPNEDGSEVTRSQITRHTKKQDLLEQLLKRENGFTKTIRQPNAPTQTVHAASPAAPTSPALAPSSEPPSPNTSQPTHSSASILAFIRDLRPGFEGAKGQVTEILVPCLMGAERLPVYIMAADVMRAIQGTSAAIRGKKLVTVSQQHPEHPDYQITFATPFDPENLDDNVYSPAMIRYPPLGKLFLLINESCEDTELQSMSSDEGKISEDKSHTEKVKKNTRAEVVEKLRADLKERDGYEEYKERCRHKLSNPQVVENWSFICRFYDESRETRATSLKGRRPKAITQQEVSDALGCSLSTLKNALTGYRVVKKHGREGKSPIQQVIDELERKDGPQQGATYLLTFLEKYDK
ncbi:hypothetical protein V5O48_017718 [Marasmius crinis-equi]|uniref:Uncharacterized protein n=1 Tax=Marasmius crinis-equi TaxID=585013 RepID=A0ABR3EN61_9AGAR